MKRSNTNKIELGYLDFFHLIGVCCNRKEVNDTYYVQNCVQFCFPGQVSLFGVLYFSKLVEIITNEGKRKKLDNFLELLFIY